MTTPRIDHPDDIATLRDVLDRAPFTGEAIRAALGTEEDILSSSRDIPVHIRRLRDRGAFGALVQLFVLNVPVSSRAASDALAPLTLDTLERMAVLHVDGDVVTVNVTASDGTTTASASAMATVTPGGH